MSSSFVTATGSLTFVAIEDSWSETAAAAVNVRGFPGGDSVAISLNGQREVTRTVTAYVANRAAYDTLARMRAKLGVLFIESWDTAPVGAVLKQCSPRTPAADGTILVQAQFILT